MVACMESIVRTSRQLGAAIRRRRRQLTLAQRELASRLDVRQATISSVEAGEPGTRLKTIFDALAVLDLELVVRPRSRGSTAEFDELF